MVVSGSLWALQRAKSFLGELKFGRKQLKPVSVRGGGSAVHGMGWMGMGHQGKGIGDCFIRLCSVSLCSQHSQNKAWSRHGALCVCHTFPGILLAHGDTLGMVLGGFEQPLSREGEDGEGISSCPRLNPV